MLIKPDELMCCKDTGQGKQLRKYVVMRISSFGWGEDILHGNGMVIPKSAPHMYNQGLGNPGAAR